MTASRRSAASCVASSSVGGCPGLRTQSASISRAEPLRRAPGAAHDPLRLRLRLDEREHALGDRLLAERLERPRVRRCSTSSATSRSASSRKRGELVRAEEVLERHLGALAGVDLAGAEPLLQRLRRQVDQDHLVGLVEDPVGERLADARSR